jgi:ABC-type Fe3+ transport system permease subunit
VIGTLAAVPFGRTDGPVVRVLGESFPWPVHLSALALSFGRHTVCGPSGYLTVPWNSVFEEPSRDLYTLPGMAAIAGGSLAPVAYIHCMSLATIAEPSLEEAARVSAPAPYLTLRRIALPLMRPALVACDTILFISPFEEYAAATFLFAPGSEAIGTALPHLRIQDEPGLVATRAAIQVVVMRSASLRRPTARRWRSRETASASSYDRCSARRPPHPRLAAGTDPRRRRGRDATERRQLHRHGAHREPRLCRRTLADRARSWRRPAASGGQTAPGRRAVAAVDACERRHPFAREH